MDMAAIELQCHDESGQQFEKNINMLHIIKNASGHYGTLLRTIEVRFLWRTSVGPS